MIFPKSLGSFLLATGLVFILANRSREGAR